MAYSKYEEINGAKLKEYRKKFSITQQQLADEFGVDRTVISNWEIGTYQMSNITKVAIKLFFEKLENNL